MVSRPIQIALLDYPGAQQAALHGLRDLFDTASSLAAGNATRTLQSRVLRPDELPGPRSKAVPDYVILPPCLAGPPAAEAMSTLPIQLKRLHGQGTRLCSICAGAFVLGATGLLDDRTATTHWALADAFRERFPAIRLDPSKMIIDLDDVLTGGGVMAWIDVGLRLIERHLGATVKLETARMFLVDPASREQSFYAQLSPKLAHGDASIRRVQGWMQAHLDERIDIPDLAAMARLGSRTFLRRFRAATGETPLQYLQGLRIQVARTQLEASRTPVGTIAWSVGYANESAFRKVFMRQIGMTPGAYRQRCATRT